MRTWQIYDHVDSRGRNVVEATLDCLDPKARARVHAKIVMLRQYGGDLPTRALSDTDERHIKKLRVTGRINWRILICRGPVDVASEFTVIDAVQEKDNKMPAGATAKAETIRQQISASPKTRRTQHDFEKYAAPR
jgi:hypothetical protein